jgi:hypothetical protein
LEAGDVHDHPVSASKPRTNLSTNEMMDSLSCYCTAFYDIGMASTMTPTQIQANYVHLMGPQAGEAFAELMQDAARLHLKWNEFLALFGVGPGQIDVAPTIKQASGSFDCNSDGVLCHRGPKAFDYQLSNCFFLG